MNKGKFFSAALYKENLKRFWSLAAIGFFIYFMSAPFTLMQGSGITGIGRIFFGYGSRDVAAYFLQMLLKNRNVGFEFIHLVLPVVSAVAVFSYLNKVNSTGAVHAMPFSRRMLFITNYASGLTLSFVPFLINWAICFLLKGSISTPLVPMTAGMFFSWLLASFAIIIFVFSIAVLACTVSGNTVISTLTGFAFNFLAAVLMLCFYGYAYKFLTGFNGENVWDVVARSTPWLQTIVQGGLFPLESLIYIVVAVIIAVLADVLYHIRQLERCGDSYVFSWMQTIIGFLFVFVITSGTGLVLFDGLGITAYIIGFIIGFLLGQMISLKTLHIFNRTCLRNLVIFAVIMALILAGFAIDITGFKKSVPEASKVESAEITTRFFNTYYTTRKITEKESMDALLALHGELIGQIEKLREPDSYSYYSEDPYRTEELTINYRLKNGKTQSRSYTVPVSLLTESENYKKLSRSKDVLKFFDDVRTITADVRTLYVENALQMDDAGVPYYSYDTKHLDLSDAETDRFLAAYADDLLDSVELYYAQGGKDMTDEVCTVILKCDVKGQDIQAVMKRYEGIYGFSGIDKSQNDTGYTTVEFIFGIRTNHKRAVSFLNEKGALN